MASAQTVLDIARAQLGTAENPPASNNVLYTRWAGMVGQPWCDIFVSWCFDQAGMRDTEGFHAYTPEHYATFNRRGRGHPGTAGIAPGDVVFYDFPGGPDRISHTGFVERVYPDGSFDAIEGNTDEAGGRTGGKVMRHRRASSVVGYGRPDYTTDTGGFDMDDAKALEEFANVTKRTGAQLDAAVANLRDQAQKHNKAQRDRDAKILAVLERIATKLGA